MKARMLSIAASLVAVGCGVLALAASAMAEPRRAETTVSIQTWPGGVFGYVDSTRPDRCAAHRKVKVFRQRGGRRNPRRDKLLGTATTERNRGYQWSLSAKRAGNLYAKTTRTSGCRIARSDVTRASGGNDVPNCPSKEDVCHFPNMHVDLLEIHPCPSFTAKSGNCGGSSEGGASPWSPEDIVSFYWNQQYATDTRDVSYQSYYSPDDEHSKIKAQLQGSVPGPGSANFSISDASALGWDVHWRTPDLPGVGAGQQGGPLYLDFENGSWGADVYIRGYLYRK